MRQLWDKFFVSFPRHLAWYYVHASIELTFRGQKYIEIKVILEIKYALKHRLRTPREEIAFTAWSKIHSHSQIFRYDRSIFCLPYRPKFSNIFYLCQYSKRCIACIGNCCHSEVEFLLVTRISTCDFTVTKDWFNETVSKMDGQGIRLGFEQINQYDKTVLLQSLEKGYYSLTSNTPVRGTLLGIQSRLFSSCQD